MRHALFACIVVFGFPAPAFSYLDPGTGSYFLQIAAAFALGGLYLLKIYWRKLASLVRRILPFRSQEK